MRKKYLIFDLDGTLIDNTTKEFFPWVAQSLLELSKDYQLFLTTRSDDEAAKNILKAHWVYDVFDIVLWGTVMEKSVKHIEVIEMYLDDKNFSQCALYMWDSEFDEAIAEESYIPYVSVWNKNCHTRHIIESVTQLEGIIKNVR